MRASAAPGHGRHRNGVPASDGLNRPCSRFHPDNERAACPLLDRIKPGDRVRFHADVVGGTLAVMKIGRLQDAEPGRLIQVKLAPPEERKLSPND